MFDKVKGMYEFQKKARRIQKELKNTSFLAEGRGLTVTANGAMEIVQIQIEEETKESMSAEKLGSEIASLCDKAIQKAQKHAATKMREITGGMGIPGM